MAMDISGFGAFGNPRHMAPHTVAKRMDRMRQIVVYHRVAGKALLRACGYGLRTSGRCAYLMYVMT